MIESTLKAEESQNGYGARNLTTHSTGARISLDFIVNLPVMALNARPVNSGVRRARLSEKDDRAEER
jgi:hypothetical protein